MEYSEQVVSVLTKAVVMAVEQKLAEYDTQLEKRLRNLVITGDNIKPLSIGGDKIGSGAVRGSNIANNTITGKNILAQSITGELIANGSLTGVKIQDGTLSAKALVTNEITTEIMNTVVANIASANIDWAQVKTLNADYATVINAVIENLQAGSAIVDELEAKLATIQGAIIDRANIGYAQIKDLATQTALITRSEQGKTHITDLEVSSANIVSLLADKIMVRGKDGEYYALIPDGSNVISEQVKIQGSTLIDGSVSNEALVKNSITVNELNTSEIMANEAFILELTAGIGKFGQLFANEAIIEQLKTHLIETDYLTMKIKDEIQWSSGDNMLHKTTDEPTQIEADDAFLIENLPIIYDDLKPGQKITFRTHLAPDDDDWQVMLAFSTVGVSGSLGTMKFGTSQLGYKDGLGVTVYGNVVRAGEEDWSTVTAVIPDHADHVSAYLVNTTKSGETECVYHSPKLELGEIATSWSPNASDYEFDVDGWDHISNTVMTLDSHGIEMRGGVIDILSGAALNLKTGGKMNIESGGNMTIKAHGSMDIESLGALNIKSGGTLAVESQGKMTLKSGSELELLAGSTLSLTGALVKIKADASVDVESGGSISLSAGSNLSLLSGSALVVASEAEMMIAAGGSLHIQGESGLVIESGGSIDLNGGNITMTGGALSLTSGGSITIDGGDLAIKSSSSLTIASGGNLLVETPNFVVETDGSVKMTNASIAGNLSVINNDIAYPVLTTQDMVIGTNLPSNPRPGMINVIVQDGGAQLDTSVNIQQEVSMTNQHTYELPISNTAFAGDVTYYISFPIRYNGIGSSTGARHIVVSLSDGTNTITQSYDLAGTAGYTTEKSFSVKLSTGKLNTAVSKWYFTYGAVANNVAGSYNVTLYWIPVGTIRVSAVSSSGGTDSWKEAKIMVYQP